MAKDTIKEIVYKIQRYNPEKDQKLRFQLFTIPTKRGMTILDGLIYIKENLDGTLAFRTSCRMGICGSCGMLVNNYPHLACHTQIEEFRPDIITLKPLPNLAIIKDLVVDLTLMFANHKSIKPFIIRQDEKEMAVPSAEYKQSPPELDAFEQFLIVSNAGFVLPPAQPQLPTGSSSGRRR